MPTPSALSRAEAFRLLAWSTLATWSVEKRREQLEVMQNEAWQDHPRWSSVPADVRSDFAAGRVVPSDPRFDPLLLLAIEQGLEGVSSGYLTERLGRAVTGEVEPRLACPCCRYLTLEERGGYDICPVCFWEDDGVDELDGYSGPNHMTLAQGRQAFARLGAVSARERAFVAPDGPRRYPRASG